MKKSVFAFSVLCVSFLMLALAPYSLEAPTWDVDKGHSSVSFSVRHFFAEVVGAFDEFSGEVTFAPDDLENSSVSFTVQVGSVNTKNERRDGHLQSADFFDAEKWPTMTFQSSSFKLKEGAENEYIITGEMTVRDVTKVIEIPATFLGAMEHPRRKGSYIGGFSSEFVIDRNEYGVGAGNYVATTTIGGEVKVKINLEVKRSDS